jgi:hypothetical protein
MEHTEKEKNKPPYNALRRSGLRSARTPVIFKPITCGAENLYFPLFLISSFPDQTALTVVFTA